MNGGGEIRGTGTDPVVLLAARLREARLALPARLLVEAHLPLAGLFAALGHVVTPLAAPVIGPERLRRLTDACLAPGAPERFLEELGRE